MKQARDCYPPLYVGRGLGNHVRLRYRIWRRPVVLTSRGMRPARSRGGSSESQWGHASAMDSGRSELRARGTYLSN